MEIGRNQQPAAKDTGGEVNRHEHKAYDAGNSKQNPVGAGYKCENALLNFHLIVSSLLFRICKSPEIIDG